MQDPLSSDATWPARGKVVAQDAPVLWGILPGRDTQHACQLSEDGTILAFRCLQRGFNVGHADTRLVPWPPEMAVLCRRQWCQGHYDASTSLSAAQRTLMRKSLLKIAKELEEHGPLS